MFWDYQNMKPLALFVVIAALAAQSASAGAGRIFPTRSPTDPGTPPLIAAGSDAEQLAHAALDKPPEPNNPATNATHGAPGANPPSDVDGNFVIGPEYTRAPELTVVSNVPHGEVRQFIMDSADSKYFPGIARSSPGVVDTNNPRTLIVQTHRQPYQRTVTVYVPAQYARGTAAPFMVLHDGPKTNQPDRTLPEMLDNMIAQRRVPPLVLIMIANGGGDAQGSERGLEYDTMSGKFAEFIEYEVLPRVETNCGVRLTKDPEGRAAMGYSSGGAAALEMAWYHPEWYHRVIAYSGTFVNQQWPFNSETPGGAWDFHAQLIPNSPPKAIRLWLEVGDRDLFNPNVMRDDMHDWVAANNRMAIILRAKGYHYQYVYARNAGHVDSAVRLQTFPEALEWTWRGYTNSP